MMNIVANIVKASPRKQSIKQKKNHQKKKKKQLLQQAKKRSKSMKQILQHQLQEQMVG
jgi:hypothetical protein